MLYFKNGVGGWDLLSHCYRYLYSFTRGKAMGYELSLAMAMKPHVYYRRGLSIDYLRLLLVYYWRKALIPQYMVRSGAQQVALHVNICSTLTRNICGKYRLETGIIVLGCDRLFAGNKTIQFGLLYVQYLTFDFFSFVIWKKLISEFYWTFDKTILNNNLNFSFDIDYLTFLHVPVWALTTGTKQCPSNVQYQY